MMPGKKKKSISKDVSGLFHYPKSSALSKILPRYSYIRALFRKQLLSHFYAPVHFGWCLKRKKKIQSHFAHIKVTVKINY